MADVFYEGKSLKEGACDLMVNNMEDEISKPCSNVELIPLGKSCIRLSSSLVWQPVKEKDYSEFKSRCGIIFSPPDRNKNCKK